MASYTTSRPVNVSQLGVELGRVALHAIGVRPDGTTTIDAPAVTLGVLRSAVDNHVANPSWTDPNPSAETVGTLARKADADAALGQIIVQAGGAANVRAKLKAVLAGADTLTPAQMQRLLAAVALWALRDRSDT